MEEPAFLSVGTEVSAKFKGAFCEARVKKVARNIKCKIVFKDSSYGACTLDETKIVLRVGCELKLNIEVQAHVNGVAGLQCATLANIKDCSLYTVVFNDGDERTLRRNQLCPKGVRYFASCLNLDDLPLGNPDRFGTPHSPNLSTNSNGNGSNSAKRSATIQRQGINRLRYAESSDSDMDDVSKAIVKKKPSPKALSTINNYEEQVGKVVSVKDESVHQSASDIMVAAVLKQKPRWFPALVICPSAQKNMTLRHPDEILVRSFKDGRYMIATRDTVDPFDVALAKKVDHCSLRGAIDKALAYVEKDELPPHWDRDLLMRQVDESSSDQSDDEDVHSDQSDNDSQINEQRDRFVAQLYKYQDERGTPINKAPILGGQDLNLYKFYSIVMKFGGYNRVCNKGTWREVLTKMKLEGCAGATVTTVKNCYNRYLLGFDAFYRQLGWRMEETQNRSRSAVSRTNRIPAQKNSAKTCKKSKNSLPSTSSTSAELETSSKISQISPENSAETCGKSIESEKRDWNKTDSSRRASAGDGGVKDGVSSTSLIPPLSVGQKIKAPYGNGPNTRWYEARVLQIDGGEGAAQSGQCRVYIHYHGWKSRYDEWVDACLVHHLDEMANDTNQLVSDKPPAGKGFKEKTPLRETGLKCDLLKSRANRANSVSVASEKSTNSASDNTTASGKESPAMRKLAAARKQMQLDNDSADESDDATKSDASSAVLIGEDPKPKLIDVLEVNKRCSSADLDRVSRSGGRKRPPSTPLPYKAKKKVSEMNEELSSDGEGGKDEPRVTRSRAAVNQEERRSLSRESAIPSRCSSVALAIPYATPLTETAHEDYSLNEEVKKLIHKAEREAGSPSPEADLSDYNEEPEINISPSQGGSTPLYDQEERPASKRTVRYKRRKRQYSHMETKPAYKYKAKRVDNDNSEDECKKDILCSPKDTMACMKARILLDMEHNPNVVPSFAFAEIDESIQGEERVNLIMDRMQQIKQLYSKLRNRLFALERRWKKSQDNKKKRLEQERLAQQEAEVIRMIYNENQSANK